jgi:hypothetical protein
MENKKTFPTALTHFFNLTTTANHSRKFEHRGIQQDAPAALQALIKNSISTLFTD